MDLWIRSQDKRSLIKVIYFGFDNVLNTGELGIRGYFSENKYKMLGYYETEKRALEVLDEIQNMLKPKLLVKINEFDEQEVHEKIRTNIFYEMPEE